MKYRRLKCFDGSIDDLVHVRGSDKLCTAGTLCGFAGWVDEAAWEPHPGPRNLSGLSGRDPHRARAGTPSHEIRMPEDVTDGDKVGVIAFGSGAEQGRITITDGHFSIERVGTTWVIV